MIRPNSIRGRPRLPFQVVAPPGQFALATLQVASARARTTAEFAWRVGGYRPSLRPPWPREVYDQGAHEEADDARRLGVEAQLTTMNVPSQSACPEALREEERNARAHADDRYYQAGKRVESTVALCLVIGRNRRGLDARHALLYCPGGTLVRAAA